MLNNKHLQFWLAVGSLMSIITLLSFIIITAANEEILIKKQYCIFLIPFLIYIILQASINYVAITETEETNKKE